MKYLKYKISLLSATFMFPLLALAQFGGSTELTNFGNRIINFINGIVVPAAFGVALLLFVYGIFRLYILDSADDERKRARQYVLWAVIGLVVVVSVWGITSLIAGGLGFEGDTIDGLIPNASGR